MQWRPKKNQAKASLARVKHISIAIKWQNSMALNTFKKYTTTSHTWNQWRNHHHHQPCHVFSLPNVISLFIFFGKFEWAQPQSESPGISTNDWRSKNLSPHIQSRQRLRHIRPTNRQCQCWVRKSQYYLFFAIQASKNRGSSLFPGLNNNLEKSRYSVVHFLCLIRKFLDKKPHKNSNVGLWNTFLIFFIFTWTVFVDENEKKWSLVCVRAAYFFLFSYEWNEFSVI